MFRTPLQDVDFQQVETFCRVWPEGVRVEYKQEMTQIPKIVSSFANTMGGIWLIGVKTDRKTNMPIFPLDGILAKPGIEEGISQACWTGIYPALTPAIKVIPLPSNPANPERVVVAVKVPESIEAPHAIENTTKVYIRNASTTEPIEFAEIDRIEYLLNRRRDPEQRREQMIEVASRRTSVSARRIRIMIGPKYPYRPLFAREELDKRYRDLRARGVIRWSMRPVQQGLISLPQPSDDEQFEVNQYGLICYARALGVQFSESEVVYQIGHLLRIAVFLLEETTMNIFIRVRLEAVEGYEFAQDTSIPEPLRQHHHALEPMIVAETDAFRETLLAEFTNHVTELVRQLMWAFNWADDRAIQSFVRDFLQHTWPDLST